MCPRNDLFGQILGEGGGGERGLLLSDNYFTGDGGKGCTNVVNGGISAH